MQNAHQPVPALVLTRALSLLMLALMLAAVVFCGWLAIRYLGQIGV